MTEFSRKLALIAAAVLVPTGLAFGALAISSDTGAPPVRVEDATVQMNSPDGQHGRDGKSGSTASSSSSSSTPDPTSTTRSPDTRPEPAPAPPAAPAPAPRQNNPVQPVQPVQPVVPYYGDDWDDDWDD